MWAHPGKQLLFMGGELAQRAEWSQERGSLDWHLLDDPDHAGVRALVRDLNAAYRDEPALWQRDHMPEGFAWLEGGARDENLLAFARYSAGRARVLVCLCNLSPVPRDDRRVPLPLDGVWREVLNTDSRFYAGSDVGNLGAITAEAEPLHGWEFSAEVVLPPLATVWLVPGVRPQV
jgi:1,4-alpha-glucan branching enzyme